MASSLLVAPILPDRAVVVPAGGADEEGGAPKENVVALAVFDVVDTDAKFPKILALGAEAAGGAGAGGAPPKRKPLFGAVEAELDVDGDAAPNPNRGFDVPVKETGAVVLSTAAVAGD